MSDQSIDPSIFEEPHLKKFGYKADPSEKITDKTLKKSTPENYTEEQKIEHNVWDEPSLSHELVDSIPPDQLTYSQWLLKKQKETSILKTWGATLVVSLLAGPWAVMGAFWGTGQSLSSALILVVFAPVVEETMKIASALYIVEKKPFLFRSKFQIVICILSGSFLFSLIENLLYIYVYIPDPSELLIHWRWTICVAIHMGCSTVAGMGLLQIWKNIWSNLERPKISLGYPYLVTAAVIHGSYNAVTLILDISGLFK